MKRSILIFITVFLCCGIMACGNEKKSGSIPSADASSTTKPTGDNLNYETGVVLSDKLDDFTFQIDNVVYQLPITQEAFVGNGWSFYDYFDDFDKPINSEHYESVYLYKGENEICVNVINKSGDQKKFTECPVGRVSYDFSGNIQFFLAGNFLLNDKTLDEVIAQYGTPTAQDEYTEYIEISYQKTDAEWIYERYTLRFDTQTKKIKDINIVNFIGGEISENNASDTAYLSKYVAPTELGSDLSSFNIMIMDDLYNLPAPVNEFVKNGWSIVESCDVGAGTYVNEGITMCKNGVVAQFDVFNFSKFQVDAKDATVYRINVTSWENSNLDLTLPGNIKLGMSKKEVEEHVRLHPDIQKEESELSFSFHLPHTYSQLLEIWFSKEDNVVGSITVIQRECSYY